MKAVILAGGIGSRLRPFTEIIPKPLLPVGEKSVLEIQISNLKKHGFDTIYFATNYKSEYIENFFGDGSKYGVDLQISKEDEPLGTAGPLSLLENKLKEPFLVINGDVLTNMDCKKMYDFANTRDSILTVGTKTITRPFEFGKIYQDGEFITGIEEKPNIKYEILAGIYVMRPGVLEYIPKNKYFGIDELIKVLLKQQLPILKYEVSEFWLDIGQIEDYEKAQTEYNKHFD